MFGTCCCCSWHCSRKLERVVMSMTSDQNHVISTLALPYVYINFLASLFSFSFPIQEIRTNRPIDPRDMIEGGELAG